MTSRRTHLRHTRLARWLITGSVATACVLTNLTCRADTVASLLGDFTINQYAGLQLANDAVKVRYSVVLGQLPALRELHVADTDGDGVTSQAERDAYVEKLAPTLADNLRLTVDGAAVPLRAARWTTALPTEQGGFSLRLDIDLAGTLPPATARGAHAVQFRNDNYAGKFGWQEIVVEASPALHVFDTDAYSSSLTAGLTEAVQQMPAAGPLSERSVHMTVSGDPVPAGATALAPRGVAAPESAAAAAPSPVSPADASWLQRETRRLIASISGPDVAPHVLLLACLGALLLGAAHAFSPGHGKAVVGAYLIGSRATPRHAVFLGATVTITHTIVVFALGFATLFASRYVVPERLFPILNLLSGLLVLAMGVVLLTQRWRALRGTGNVRGVRERALRVVRNAAPVYRTLQTAAPNALGRGFVLAHAHDHRQGHAHHGTVMHSHGGKMHSHLPPGAAGEKVTWRSLLALGISGGLVPCPSALVLLLAAVALNQTVYGLILVTSFSIGLAITLTAVGLAFLYARHRISRPLAHSPWVNRLPVLSAAAITLVGAMLCYTALAGNSLL